MEGAHRYGSPELGSRNTSVELDVDAVCRCDLWFSVVASARGNIESPPSAGGSTVSPMLLVAPELGLSPSPIFSIDDPGREFLVPLCRRVRNPRIENSVGAT